MIEGLTIFDICNTKAKARTVELLLTCTGLPSCSCRFCTGKYFEVQEKLKEVQEK